MKPARVVLLVVALAVALSVAFLAIKYRPSSYGDVQGSWVSSTGGSLQLAQDGSFAVRGLDPLPDGEGSWAVNTCENGATEVRVRIEVLGPSKGVEQPIFATFFATGFGPWLELSYHYGDADTGPTITLHKGG